MAQSRGRDVQAVATRFTLEAALRRLFTSEHASKFGLLSLKGGSLMFFSEGVEPVDGRSTRDIDIQLGAFEGTMAELAAIMREVPAGVPAVDDGVRFDTDTLTVTGTRDGGVPVDPWRPPSRSGATYRFKVDCGFYPLEASEDLEIRDYPSLLPGQLSPIVVYCQPREYAIADKVQAAVRHGAGTGRLRDFYDKFVMLGGTGIDDAKVAAALKNVFPLYGSPLPASVDEVEAYGADFIADNAAAWDRLRERAGWAIKVPDVGTVIAVIKERLEPILELANEPVYGVAA